MTSLADLRAQQSMMFGGTPLSGGLPQATTTQTTSRPGVFGTRNVVPEEPEEIEYPQYGAKLDAFGTSLRQEQVGLDTYKSFMEEILPYVNKRRMTATDTNSVNDIRDRYLEAVTGGTGGYTAEDIEMWGTMAEARGLGDLVGVFQTGNKDAIEDAVTQIIKADPLAGGGEGKSAEEFVTEALSGFSEEDKARYGPLFTSMLEASGMDSSTANKVIGEAMAASMDVSAEEYARIAEENPALAKAIRDADIIEGGGTPPPAFNIRQVQNQLEELSKQYSDLTRFESQNRLYDAAQLARDRASEPTVRDNPLRGLIVGDVVKYVSPLLPEGSLDFLATRSEITTDALIDGLSNAQVGTLAEGMNGALTEGEGLRLLQQMPSSTRNRITNLILAQLVMRRIERERAVEAAVMNYMDSVPQEEYRMSELNRIKREAYSSVEQMRTMSKLDYLQEFERVYQENGNTIPSDMMGEVILVENADGTRELRTFGFYPE